MFNNYRNLQAAICSYLDYTLPPKLPSMALIKSESHETAVGPGTWYGLFI